MTEQVKPRQAATVVLLRAAGPKGFEIFFTRRPDDMAFLGGMYCFPGGTVTKEDWAPRMTERCRGRSADQARKIVGARFSPRQALGFWIAAARELFEEVGVLLAVGADGKRVDVADASRGGEKHDGLGDRSVSFVALLERENLYCDLTGLAYFSHWQTPSQTPLRFDTRFFVAALPPGQTPCPTSAEVTHSVWLTPELAMQRYARGELPMIFPTFTSIRTLADFESLDSVMKEFSGYPRTDSPSLQT
jgi:8-oxo-dGTP pyrophosphatase MutT (NUDIX family)